MSPKKDALAQVRMTPAQKKQIEALAKAQGKNVSDYLRALAFPERGKPAPRIHKQAGNLADEFPVSPGLKHPRDMKHGQVTASEWNRAVNEERFRTGADRASARKTVTQRLGPYPSED